MPQLLLSSAQFIFSLTIFGASVFDLDQSDINFAECGIGFIVVIYLGREALSSLDSPGALELLGFLVIIPAFAAAIFLLVLR